MAEQYDPRASFSVQRTDDVYRRDADGDWGVRIYQPQGTGPFPVLLSVHGGAWTTDGWPNNIAIETALSASGLVVAAIQLRRAPTHKYPASVADVNYGIRWLKAQARELNGDPSRVGALGFSSGGHLVPLCAMRPADPRYSALPLPEAPNVDATLDYVMVAWPVIDPWARYMLAQQNGLQNLVDSHRGYFVTDEAMKEGNPQLLLDRGERAVLPPLLIVHGDADTLVLPSMVERFAASYRAAGGAADLEFFKGMPHGFMRDQPGPEPGRALKVIKQFIARQLAGAGIAAQRA